MNYNYPTGPCSGSSWTSRNSPSAPAATPARTIVGMNSASPPEAAPRPPGRWTMCEASMTTGHPRLLHDRDRADIEDQVVVAEERPAFGEQDICRFPGCPTFSTAFAISCGREELALLEVERLSRPGGLDEQVGLPAEEGRDLDDVQDLGRRLDLARSRGHRRGRERPLPPSPARRMASPFSSPGPR